MSQRSEARTKCSNVPTLRAGVLWAASAKSIHYMVPFRDVALTRLKVAPSFELAESFKVITVSQDNDIWTSEYS